MELPPYREQSVEIDSVAAQLLCNRPSVLATTGLGISSG